MLPPTEVYGDWRGAANNLGFKIGFNDLRQAHFSSWQVCSYIGAAVVECRQMLTCVAVVMLLHVDHWVSGGKCAGQVGCGQEAAALYQMRVALSERFLNVFFLVCFVKRFTPACATHAAWAADGQRGHPGAAYKPRFIAALTHIRGLRHEAAEGHLGVVHCADG
eukprot:1158417-Pelagomonas_calceolata.AAC.1